MVLAVVLDCLYPLQPDIGYSYAVLGLGAVLGIGAGLSLLGGFFNSRSQSDTNFMNASLQNKANELNYKMFHEQMDYNTQMFEEQKAYNNQLISQMNDYNRPAAQMQRYREAGINPYFAMGNIDSGNAQSQVGVSAPSAPSATPMQAAQMQPVDYTFLGNAGRDIASIYDTYSRGELASAQAANQRVQNIFAYDKEIIDLQQKIASGRLNEAQRKVADEQLYQLKAMRSDLIAEQRYNTLSAAQRKEQAVLDTEIKKNEKSISDILLSWQSKLSQKQFEHLVAQIDNIKASTAVEYQNKIESIARTAGIKLSNDQIKQLTPLLVKQQQLNNKQQDLDNKYGTGIYQGATRLFDKFWHTKSDYKDKSPRAERFRVNYAAQRTHNPLL